VCYSESREESLESKEDDSTSVASPVLGMRAMGAPMILQESSTGVNGDAFLVQGWDRTQPLTVDSPASQGLLFPIEATKSKGSQRERHTRPDSDSVRHDRFTCPANLDRGADTSTLTTPLTLKAGTGIQLKTDSEAVKTSPHGVSPSVRSTPGIRDAAPALYNYVCSVLQQDSDPSPTNPGHSVLPSDMAPRTNIISARLSNSPEEARVSVGTGKQGGTTRGSPPTVGGSFSVDSGGSFSVGNIGQSRCTATHQGGASSRGVF